MFIDLHCLRLLGTSKHLSDANFFSLYLKDIKPGLSIDSAEIQKV